MRGCRLPPVQHGFPKMEKKLKKIRADELLLKNKLCESRTQAKVLIMAGQVRSGSERIDKPSRLLREDCDLSILRPLKFVGRGGLKMENFLLESNFDVKNLHIFDIGASTGGFTDCLLQKGASLATCVDVGHGQLHYRLRTDPRVKNLEKTRSSIVPTVWFSTGSKKPGCSSCPWSGFSLAVKRVVLVQGG